MTETDERNENDVSDYIADPRKRIVELVKYIEKLDELLAERPDLFIPSEVADLMRVDPKTVTRWAKAGKVFAIKTLGGHRRYYKADIRREMARVYARAIGCNDEEFMSLMRTEAARSAIPAQRKRS